MKRDALLKTLTAGLLALALYACGGGGGGGGGGTVSTDIDGDGIPNVQDVFPDDPARFAGFSSSPLGRITGGTYGVATAVNDASSPLVVGSSDDGTGILKAVSWTVGAGQPTAPIVLNPLAGNGYSAAYGVNDAGVVVGESEKGLSFVPVFWGAGSTIPTELSLTVGGATFTDGSAYGIDDNGRIVGEIKRADGTLTAVLWSSSGAAPVELATLGGPSASAYFIAGGGWIVGESETGGGQAHATLWTLDAGGIPSAPVDLGILPGHVASIALGVDGAGRIVGESEQSDGTTNAVIWEKNALGVYAATDLGAGASAAAINGGDRIAGDVSSEASVWDARSVIRGTSNKLLPAGFSKGLGQNQGGMVVGLREDQGFVAVPQ